MKGPTGPGESTRGGASPGPLRTSPAVGRGAVRRVRGRVGRLVRRRALATSVVALAVAVAMVASLLAVTTAPSSASGPSNLGPVHPAAGALAVTLSPSPAKVDDGQSVNLTADASGGTPPYTQYIWYEGADSTCSGDDQVAATTTPTFTTSALGSDQYVCVSATDNESPPVTALSAADSLIVAPVLIAGSVGPAAALAPTGTVDDGQPVTLTGGATNGTDPLHYQWYDGPAPGSCTSNRVVGATNATFSVRPTSTTSYCYSVTDSSVGAPEVEVQSGPATVTVDPALTAGAPAPTGLYGDSGQTFTLRSAPGGGTGDYTYQWRSGTSTACSSDVTDVGTAPTVTVTPAVSTYYCYSLTDTSYNAPVDLSATTEVRVNATLTAGPITPSSPAIDRGTPETVTLRANPTGGALGPAQGYLFQWYAGNYSNCLADASVPGGTSSTYTVAPTTTTYYCYRVTDANGTSALSSTTLLVVDPALLAGVPTPGVAEIDAGQSATLTAAPSGGTPPYAYQWFEGSSCGSGSLIAGATGASLTVTAAGTYVYRVTDSSTGALVLGQRSACSSANASVTVNTDPIPTAPTVTPTVVDLGQPVTLTGSVPAGSGTPVVSFQWRSGSSKACSADPDVAGATATTYTAYPVATAYYCYAVTDGSVDPPTELSSTVLVTVNGPPVAGAVTTVTGTSSIDLGTNESVALLAHASGGTGAYTYQWFAGPSLSCPADTTPVGTGTATYTTPTGLAVSTDYCYAVTDARGQSGETSAAFAVTVNPALHAGTPTSRSSSVDLGLSVTLTATPSGGTSPYTYQWFTAATSSCTGLSLVAGATSSPATITPSSAGLTDYCYRVTDASNGTPVQESAYSHTALAIDVYGTLEAGPITCYDNTTRSVCAVPVPNGDTVTLAAHAENGTAASYAYQWYSGPSTVCASDPAVAGGNTSTLTFVASSSPGAYYCYTVSDGAHGESATSATTFVDPPSDDPALSEDLALVAPSRES